ncbi:MAG: acyl carrier protein [Maribacter sp.]|nr:acyl carrier protein [Maribacter sp.]
MKTQVIELIKEILSEKDQKIDFEITENSNLRELGMSSYDLATLTVNIEDEFDIDVFEDGVVETVGEVIKVLESKKG